MMRKNQLVSLIVHGIIEGKYNEYKNTKIMIGQIWIYTEFAGGKEHKCFESLSLTFQKTFQRAKPLPI